MPSDSSPRSVLLVHPDAASWLQDRSLGDAVTPTDSARAARAHLAGTPFDLVLVGPEVEGADAIGALRDILGLDTTIERVADLTEVEARLGIAPASEPATPPASGAGSAHSAGETAEATSGLDEIATSLSRVAHDLNNPLAVIAGNAQLALEMASALGTDETIVESLKAIDGAASKLEALFSQIADLREIVHREREKSESA